MIIAYGSLRSHVKTHLVLMTAMLPDRDSYAVLQTRELSPERVDNFPKATQVGSIRAVI
jgi:hypothetical protein